MVQDINLVTKPKHAGGRPSLDISRHIGPVPDSRLTIIGRATTGYGRGVSGLLSKTHVWVNCACACGRYTASDPKAIRLDHILDPGPSRTVSCGCRRKETACENAEFHTKEECSPAKIAALFSAFCRNPGKVAEIAKRYSVSVWVVCAAFRIERKAMAEKFGDWIRSGKLSVPCELGVRAWRLLLKYVLRNEPTAVFELDEDILTDHQRDMFCLSPAFASI
jgi:hypothetical protein